MPKRRIADKQIFTIPQYWFHISSTLIEDEIVLIPRTNDEGFNRADHEPNIARICVSPTLEQCIVAIPYHFTETYQIYQTFDKVIPIPSQGIFDSDITDEGWLTSPTKFIKKGILDMTEISRKPYESATSGDLEETKRTLKRWKKIDPWKYALTTSKV